MAIFDEIIFYCPTNSFLCPNIMHRLKYIQFRKNSKTKQKGIVFCMAGIFVTPECIL